MAKTLTAAAVRQLKPQAGKRPEIPDGGCPGLYVVIHPTGRKMWAFRFRRPDGRPAKLTLGTVDETGEPSKNEPMIGGHLTLAAARTLASRQREVVARGEDPALILAEAKFQRRQAASDTFEAAARLFIERHCKPNNRSWRKTAKEFFGFEVDRQTGELLHAKKKSLVDRWGSRPVATISSLDIRRELNAFIDRGSLTAANRARSAYHKMFAFLVERGVVSENPVTVVKKPAKERQRDRVLSDEELKLFWQATEELGEPYKQPFRFLLATGQRVSEVFGMRREELDGDVWTIPGARTKNKRTHALPLSPLAVEIIESAHRFEGPFVFSTAGHGPLTNAQRVKRRLDAIMKKHATEPIAQWQLHDLRRTVATGMARCRVPVHVIERVLNHSGGQISGIVEIYNRHSYAEEVRSALEAWASLLGEITSGEPAGNVVKLRVDGRTTP